MYILPSTSHTPALPASAFCCLFLFKTPRCPKRRLPSPVSLSSIEQSRRNVRLQDLDDDKATFESLLSIVESYTQRIAFIIIILLQLFQLTFNICPRPIRHFSHSPLFSVLSLTLLSLIPLLGPTVALTCSLTTRMKEE